MSTSARVRAGAVLCGTAIGLALGGCSTSGDADTAGTSDSSGTGPVSAATPAPSSPTLVPPSPSTTASAKPRTKASSSAKPFRFTFPIKARTSFGRAHHDYAATDIFAACGSTVVAPADGTIAEVSSKDTWDADRNDGANRGGLSFTLIAADGVRFYGSHLRSLDKGIEAGVKLSSGDPIGKVGNTGDAAGIACHLHFGISPDCGKGDWWVRRGAIRPYKYLKAWQDDENLSPAKGVAEWKAKNGCPKDPPAGY